MLQFITLLFLIFHLMYPAKVCTSLRCGNLLYNWHDPYMMCCSGNIRVYCRVRPFLTDEPGRPTTVQYIGENGELVLGNPSKPGGKEPRRTFTFNKVFATTASQGRFSYFPAASLCCKWSSHFAV